MKKKKSRINPPKKKSHLTYITSFKSPQFQVHIFTLFTKSKIHKKKLLKNPKI